MFGCPVFFFLLVVTLSRESDSAQQISSRSLQYVGDSASIDSMDIPDSTQQRYIMGNKTDTRGFSPSQCNVWQSYDAWTPNQPASTTNHEAASLLITVENVRNNTTVASRVAITRRAMLIAGGVCNDCNNLLVMHTWLYYPKENAWEPISTGSSEENRPPLQELQGHTLVTLCNRVVILFGGSKSPSLSNPLKEVWAFWDRSWTDVMNSTVDSGIAPRSLHSAVAIASGHTPCDCNESMLVFGGLGESTRYLNDLWELKCVVEGKRYEWYPIELSPPKQLTKRYGHAAVADVQNSVMYIYGGSTLHGQVTDLWSYTVKTRDWNRVSDNGSTHITNNKTISPKFIRWGSMYLRDGQQQMMLICCPLRVYQFGSGWHSLTSSDLLLPPELAINPSLVKIDNYALLLGSPGTSAVNVMWNVSFSTDQGWELQEVVARPFNPIKQQIAVAASADQTKDRLYAFGGFQFSPYFALAAAELYTLDVETKMWQMVVTVDQPPPLYGHACAFVGTSMFVVLGGQTPDKSKGDMVVSNQTWVFNTESPYRQWRSFPSINAARYWHKMVAYRNNSFITVGGRISSHARHSLMIATIDEDSITWTPLGNPEESQFMYGHSLVLSRNSTSFIIYGGYKNGICQDTMYHFNFTTEKWSALAHHVHSPGSRCFHSAAMVGQQMVVFGGCITVELGIGGIPYCTAAGNSLWSWFIDLQEWTKIIPNVPSMYLNYLATIVVWNDVILHTGGLPTHVSQIYVTNPVSSAFGMVRLCCPSGKGNRDFANEPCYTCRKGTYSSATSQSCQNCPEDLTTTNTGSESISNCSTCEGDYCRFGTCTVSLSNMSPTPHCECDFGFVPAENSRCIIPVFYAALAGTIMMTLIIACVVRRYTQSKKQNKKLLDKKETELRLLASVWVIDSCELKLKERIDHDSPGSYGEVYRADYREMTVAVKKLHPFHRLDAIESEFDREIEVMRSVRHPNIVMFLGGGRWHSDGCPFLVLEYMPRGSLMTILERTNSFPITEVQKIRYAIDIAKGMKYLHSLQPTRIHRDLKSANLLVSDRWVIKVADFGSARLVKGEAVKQATRRYNRAPEQQPLLEPENRLTADVGTLLWSAPELLTGEPYGTAVDVYSFGIVMWELWTRQQPYKDQAFNSFQQAKRAICGGLRPAVPTGCPKGYGQLMVQCWGSACSTRPTFQAILIALEEVHDSLLLYSGTQVQ